MRHLLQVGRDVRIVPREVRIIERDGDDVLDIAFRRRQVTAVVGWGRGGTAGSQPRGERRDRYQSNQSHETADSQHRSSSLCVTLWDSLRAPPAESGKTRPILGQDSVKTDTTAA